jgi:hypothetical protein
VRCISLYDAIINFIGAPPAGLEPYVYLACIPFTMYLVSECFSLIRVFVLRCIDGHS